MADLQRPYATSYATGFGAPTFRSRCDLIAIPPTIDQGLHLRDELLLLWRTLRAAWRGQTLLLCSSRGYLRIELLSIVLIGLLLGRRRPPLALYGEMYQPDSGLRGRLQRLAMRLSDRWIDRYIVYSEDECASFAATWGVAPAKLRCCGYYHKPKQQPRSNEAGAYLFSGGNSFRAYEPLVVAMAELPAQQLLIASKAFDPPAPPPPNVRVEWPSLAEWFEVMAAAQAVVVPIAPGMSRSVGLLLITEAMWLGKPVVVSDSLGVREYVEDGVTGLVVDGTPAGYLAALRWLVDPANSAAVATMGRRAAETMEQRFTLAHHTDRLLAALDELAAERRGATARAGTARAPRPGR